MPTSKKDRIRFPISAKIIILFLSLFLVAIVAVSTADFINSKNALEDRILTDLTALAKSKAEQISNIVEQNFEITNLISLRKSLRRYLAQQEPEQFTYEKYRAQVTEDLKEIGKLTAAVKDVEVIDLKGKVVASTIPERVGKDVLSGAFFIKDRDAPWIGNFYLEGRKITYAISAPIYGSEEKNIIGVVKANFDFDNIIQILNDYTGLGKTGEVYLGKRDGSEIIFLNPLRHKQDTALKMRISIQPKLMEPLKFATDRNIGIATAIDYRGVEVLAAYQYISISDWGLVAKVDTKEAFEPIRRLLKKTILAGLLVLIFSIIVVLVSSGFILAPIEKLQKAMEVVGGGNLDYRVNVKTSDEIGKLAGSFDHMIENLKKITASRDDLNKEVESRKGTEEKLKEAMEAKNKFVAMVSHELRTPLAAIKEGISIVFDGSAGPVTKEQKKFLDIASRNVDRLARLINDILDFQRLESGKITFDFKKNDINEVVLEVYHTMSPLAKEMGLDLSTSIDQSLPKVKFDRDRIIQVCNNFMHNAFKFTKKGGIVISTSKRDGYIQVSVKDTGSGIPPEQLPKLFKSFEQVGEITTGKGGTGLGLSICKEIIERHNGKIWVSSELGKGTIFYFALPMER